ncbi:MAG TPA: hypothetical protein VKT21_06930 [Thermoplasmata archaeon]|nr:hypothetical protein [Thermoplasmata archaeon]
MDDVVEVIVDPFTQEKLPLRLPLSFATEPARSRQALGLPETVDTGDPVMARAVAMLHGLSVDLPGHPIALLGGVAYRFRSPSSNALTTGLRRPLHDIDIACHHGDAKKVHAALLALGTRHGSAVSVVETHADRMFNALMGGRRLRLHNVNEVVAGRCVLGTIDVLADEFRFCHNLDLTADISQAPKDGHTLGLATLLLTKLQFIQSIPAEHRAQVPGRVLGPFGKKELLIGPEDKDVRDILALLIDRSLGEDPGEISPARFIQPLQSDWGFWTTVRLNLDHLTRSPLFEGLPTDSRPKVLASLAALRAATDRVQPRRRFGFLQREWWEPVESFGAAPPPAGTTS